MADEVESHHTEQVPICLRFVERNAILERNF